VATD